VLRIELVKEELGRAKPKAVSKYRITTQAGGSNLRDLNLQNSIFLKPFGLLHNCNIQIYCIIV
jgi:hypothetical protein